MICEVSCVSEYGGKQNEIMICEVNRMTDDILGKQTDRMICRVSRMTEWYVR